MNVYRGIWAGATPAPCAALPGGALSGQPHRHNIHHSSHACSTSMNTQMYQLILAKTWLIRLLHWHYLLHIKKEWRFSLFTYFYIAKIVILISRVLNLWIQSSQRWSVFDKSCGTLLFKKRMSNPNWYYFYMNKLKEFFLLFVEKH